MKLCRSLKLSSRMYYQYGFIRLFQQELQPRKRRSCVSKVQDIIPAKYNPRKISKVQLEMGRLSEVVHG